MRALHREVADRIIEPMARGFLPQWRKPKPIPRNPLADAFVAATGAVIVPSGDKPSYRLLYTRKLCLVDSGAYYASEPDRIYMPPFEQFRSGHDYYATTFHELTHWTGAKPSARPRPRQVRQ